jgi:hypothetical protein
MKVTKLLQQLDIKGLKTVGLKVTLLKRLKDYCANESKARLCHKLQN